MTETISENVQSLLKYLKRSQLVGISVEPSNLSITLEFTHGTQGCNVIIKVFQVVHFIISKDPDDNDVFYVGNINLITIEDGGKEILSSLLYPFTEQDGGVGIYPSRCLFHLHIEGGICIEVVCGSYQIFQEIEIL